MLTALEHRGMTTSGNTVLNGVTGALVTVVLVFVPLSSVVGGAVAGYLQGESRGDGAVAGGLAGLVATVPLFLLSVFVVPLFVFAPFGVVTLPTGPLVFAAALLVALLVDAVTTSAVGGLVGAYLSVSGLE